MIARYLEDIFGTHRELNGPGWTNRHLLLEAENMGISISLALANQDTSLTLRYEDQIQSLYCIRGIGKIKNLKSGHVSELVAGALFVLDFPERCILTAMTELRLMCILTSPSFEKD